MVDLDTENKTDNLRKMNNVNFWYIVVTGFLGLISGILLTLTFMAHNMGELKENCEIEIMKAFNSGGPKKTIYCLDEFEKYADSQLLLIETHNMLVKTINAYLDLRENCGCNDVKGNN
jgi:hypothetical protein